MVCVFPGWELVLARDFRFIRPLIREDFPTLDFPAKATSGLPVCGILLVIPQTRSSDTCLITISFFPLCKGLQKHLFHLFHEHDLQSFCDLRLDFLHIRPIFIRNQNLLDPCLFGSQEFLLQSADGQNSSPAA